jgi:hypothetical protein
MSSFGPSAAIEFAPIKDRVFKTPLPLGLPDNVEVMFGGRGCVQWVAGELPNSLGGTAQLDFQFWQSSERKFGWFVEPSYGYSFGIEDEQSLGVTVGVLFAIL